MPKLTPKREVAKTTQKHYWTLIIRWLRDETNPMESQNKHFYKNVGKVSYKISLSDWEAPLFASKSAQLFASLHMCSMRASHSLWRSRLQSKIKLENSVG